MGQATDSKDLSSQPLRRLLMQCKGAAGVAFLLTFAIDLLGLTPMLYMMSAYDRVLSSRSGVTLVSLTLVPMLCSRFLPDHDHEPKEYRITVLFDKLFHAVLSKYEASLDWCLAHQRSVLVVALAARRGRRPAVDSSRTP